MSEGFDTPRPSPVDPVLPAGVPLLNKHQIKEQLKLGRLAALQEEGQELDWFQALAGELVARNYQGLKTLSYEYGLSLSLLGRYLEHRAAEVFKEGRMPRCCEIATLRLMLSTRAESKNLVSLYGARELDEAEARRFYFALFDLTPRRELSALAEEFEVPRLYELVWEKGLQRFFNFRYRQLKGVPDKELAVTEVIAALGLTALFDEHRIIRRYVELRDADRKGDLRDNLAAENALKNEAAARFQLFREMFEQYPCDFRRLRRVMAELRLEEELDAVEREGLEHLKDYIRAKAVIGAHEVALQYELVCPAVSGDDLEYARRKISGSFYSQGLKSKKGRQFLRTEVLCNLQLPFVGARCFAFPGGYLLAVILGAEGDEHYLYGRFPSKYEQQGFLQHCLGQLCSHGTVSRAVQRVVARYLEELTGDLQVSNAIRKVLFALPLVLGLSALIGVLYFLTLGGVVEAAMIGGLIMLIGMGIAAKNGFDEEIKPAGHEKIPSYLVRRKGKVAAAPPAAETAPEDREDLDQLLTD